MAKILSFTVLVCMLSVTSAWGAYFFDDFNRSDGNVGNGWSTQTDGTIEVKIVDNEVVITGEQGTDWVRSGLSRPVEDETRISLDFLPETFNFHIRLGDADTAAYIEPYWYPGGPCQYASSEDGSWPGWTTIDGSNMVAGEYNTLVIDQDGTSFALILNGVVVGTITNNSLTRIGSILIASDAAAGTTGTLHIDNVQIGELVVGVPRDPSPTQDAADVPRDVVLGWTPYDDAMTHDVYFGTVAEDVNSASRTNPMGVLVSQGQSTNTYDPDGLLEFGQTYYWRVDAVGTPPDNTIYKGDLWSFTAEPFVYPIENIIATASSAEAGAGPENTINGSGLNAADEHSINALDMWLSNAAGEQPTWIQYEFDAVYKLHEMLIWNYNVQFEYVLGYGVKDVTLEYSVDGAEWTVLGDYEFARGTSQSNYVANTMIDVSSVTAKYVRLTIANNWVGLAPQYGLSEVRFLYKPVQAGGPSPADGASDMDLDLTLDWRGGREATTHEVYLSSDRAAVGDGTALVDTVTESRYAVDGLALGTTYYWRIDEVNEAATPDRWEGALWSFSTKENVVVEDFESYDDDENRIYETWLDGYDIADNGSTVGYFEAPFAETSIVHGGRQSMPLFYENVNGVSVSETERDLGGQNWTLSGADTLLIHFQGNAATTPDTPGNDAAPLYVAVEDNGGGFKMVTHPDPGATVITTWQSWEIPFSELGGVNLNAVKKLYLGVNGPGSGLVFIDDIWVGHPGSSDPGTSGLVAYYALEGNVEDSSGNENHGTAVGDPAYIDGQIGSALEFDGTGAQYVDLGSLNPSAATGQLSISLWAKWNGLSGQYQGLIGKRDSWVADDMMWQIEANIDTGVIRFQRQGLDLAANSALSVDEWTHVAVVFNGTAATIYFDAEVVGEGTFSLGTDPQAATQFGASAVNGGNPFNGALDEVRLYDRILSPFEVNFLAGQ